MYNQVNLEAIKKALIKQGLKGLQLTLALCQVAHETGDFESNVLLKNNNATGIMFLNNAKQKNCKKGLPFPSKEGKYFYANFNSLDDWAIDFLRIVKKSLFSSVGIVDYATKLKNQKYFTDNLQNYIKGMNSHYKQLDKLKVFMSNNKSILLLPLIAIVTLFLIFK
jgi:hypothetical protein